MQACVNLNEVQGGRRRSYERVEAPSNLHTLRMALVEIATNLEGTRHQTRAGVQQPCAGLRRSTGPPTIYPSSVDRGAHTAVLLKPGRSCRSYGPGAARRCPWNKPWSEARWILSRTFWPTAP